MGGEIEAAGALANAGLVAGAIEGGDPGAAGSGACLNCEQPIVGARRYCSNCGQAAHAQRKVWHMVEELLHNLFHLDTKAYRTVPMLLGRPGTLMRNYTYGKRARYISPLATFLLSIFLLFFAVSSIKAPPVTLDGASRAEILTDIADARREVTDAQSELAEARAAPSPAPTEGLNVRLAEQGVRLAEASVRRHEAALQRHDAQVARRHQASTTTSTATTADGTVATTTTTQVAPGVRTTRVETADTTTATTASETAASAADDDERVTEERTWQEQLAERAKSDDFTLISGWPAANERAKRTLQNPDLAVYKLQEVASKLSFLLLPLSLPFIWLLFIWKRGLTLYDHSVFALYALSFASLLSIALIGAAQMEWLHWSIPWLIFGVLPVHTFFSLKGAYALGWWSALWRTCFMLFFAMFVLTFFLVAILILGLAS